MHGRLRLLLCLLAGLLPAPALAFGFGDVAARAQKLASEDYRAPASDLPQALQDLNYDQYRDIRFKPEQSLWRALGLPFELQFFHPGFFYRQTVRIHVVGEDGVRELAFDREAFDYGRNDLAGALREGLHYAGFRIHHRLNRADYLDELAVFLGASYFRALGQGQRYGLSARGLAIDTAELSGEEFPSFTEFWIVQPSAVDAEQPLELYALLDSRRATGAYRLRIRPGETTVVEVRAQLHLRASVKKLGIAPLTSMFQFGNGQSPEVEDYRPQVHDSDGLSIHNGNGEWIWRPLVNPPRLLVTSFGLENPRGFGLMQRDREFRNYQDLEARYDLRPSVWVEPMDKWGRGRVELVQIPTPDETNDNIVAYWVPEKSPAVGEPLDLRYRLLWQQRNLTVPKLGRVTRTLRGHGWRAQDDDSLRLMVDFEGAALRKLKPEADVDGVVWADGNGELLEKQAYRNEVTGGWRLSLRLRPLDPDGPVELRAMLQSQGKPLSETWSYILPAGAER